MVNLVLARWARVQWKRIRRREFSVLRKPQATRLVFLMIRLKPSVRALVTFIVNATWMAGHQVSMVVARRVVSGVSACAASR